MSVLSWLAGVGPSGFGAASTAEQVTDGLDLRGQRILVTGCNSGLGFEAMRVLALRGATVLGAARTHESAARACAQIAGRTEPLACELSDPASVRAAVATARRGGPLTAILANAGIMALPDREVVHGVERQLFTNHVGHFLLVTGLTDHLTPTGRVVMLSSAAHTRAPAVGIAFDDLDASTSYSPWTAYGQSKLANVLFSNELARRFAGTGRTANALHPGVIATNLTRSLPSAFAAVWRAASPLLLKSIGQGAATGVWAATHPSLASVSGEYFANCNVARPSRQARDAGLAARLWTETEAICARLAAPDDGPKAA